MFHAGCDHEMCWNLLSKQCYISLAGSGGNTLMFLRRNLLKCRQVETSSVLLLRRLSFDVMMWNFSVEQRWQNLEPLLYGRAWSITSYDIMGVVPFFFNSQTYFSSSVEFALPSCLKLFLCWFHLSLNVFSISSI